MPAGSKSDRFHQTDSEDMRTIHVMRDAVAAMFATAGIRLDRLSAGRVALLAGNILLFVAIFNRADLTIALVYFALSFSVRYLFLFLSFIPGGIAERLKRRFGEERGYAIYEAATATMFFHSGVCFSCLLHATAWMGPVVPHGYHALAGGVGTFLSLTGFVVNIWATLIIGVDIYYYRDLFLGRFLGEFKHEGPYRMFKNPMYGVGQSAAYGAALMNGSIPCLLATMLNQGMMYIFYFTIERPHIRKLIAGERRAPIMGREASAV